MNEYINDINNMDDSHQLTLFTATEESVEDLIYEFLKDRGASTERACHRDLKPFFDFTGAQFGLPKVEGNRMCFETIRRLHIIKCKKYLEVTPSCRKKPFAPSTINRKLSAVSSFFQFLLQSEVIEKNPAEFCKRPSRMVMNESQAFSDREMKTAISTSRSRRSISIVLRLVAVGPCLEPTTIGIF